MDEEETILPLGQHFCESFNQNVSRRTDSGGDLGMQSSFSSGRGFLGISCGDVDPVVQGTAYDLRLQKGEGGGLSRRINLHIYRTSRSCVGCW